MDKLSVVILAYKESSIGICLQSAIEGCSDLNNVEIIVVVNGNYEFNKPYLDKYKDHISILHLEQNVGMVKAMNLGHYNCSNNLVLHAQSDNLFDFEYDKKLLELYKPGMVLTPNQIEPIPSMFKQFNIMNLGRDPENFSLEKFWHYTKHYVNKVQPTLEESGSTFPFLISKNDYLMVGGFDESYENSWVVDWEFFMKCKMAGLKMMRTYNCHFYHFVSLGHQTTTPQEIEEKRVKEIQSHEYAKYKWGKYILHNPIDNSKYLS